MKLLLQSILAAMSYHRNECPSKAVVDLQQKLRSQSIAAIVFAALEEALGPPNSCLGEGSIAFDKTFESMNEQLLIVSLSVKNSFEWIFST